MLNSMARQRDITKRSPDELLEGKLRDAQRIRRLTTLLHRPPGPGPDIRPSFDAHLDLWETCCTDGKLPAAVEMGSRGGSAKTDKPRGPAALSPKQPRDLAHTARHA